MKRFDWSAALSLSGFAVLILGVCLDRASPLPAAVAALMCLALFFLSRARAARLKELQSRCEELTSQLEQTQADCLQQLSDMQAEHERSRSEFLSRISHSLRMPLSVIQGYAELMQNSPLDPVRESEYLSRIVQHTHRMIALLSKELSSPPEEPVPLSTNRVLDLVKVVEQYLSDLRRTAAQRGVSLQSIASEPTLPVLGDARLLQRIFFNLIENSINYMGREGIVTVLLTRKENAACVTVRDDGLGMQEREVSQIFDPNFRGSNSFRGKGSGYGLFLVKQAVEAQGGTVSASSQPGRGMSITFTLPLAESAAAANV